MNKAEFVSAMAGNGDMSKKDAERFLAAFTATLREGLQNEGRIALPGIGTFSVEERAARVGRNPATGAEIQIPAKKAIKLKAAKDLVEAVA